MKAYFNPRNAEPGLKYPCEGAILPNIIVTLNYMTPYYHVIPVLSLTWKGEEVQDPLSTSFPVPQIKGYY